MDSIPIPKWSLVTGGAVRLGREICLKLAEQKRNVVIHYRKSKSEALTLRDELLHLGVQAEIITGDFSTIASTQLFLAQYLERFPTTELLVNNVGDYFLGSSLELPPDVLQDLYQINVISPLMIIQALVTSLKLCLGHIVNIGMAGAHNVRPNTHATAYHLTKLSLAMLTKSLAKELAPGGVCVNMVSPGYLEETIDLPSDPGLQPMGRAAKPSEVTAAIAFLTSQNYITGQILEVAGGVQL